MKVVPKAVARTARLQPKSSVIGLRKTPKEKWLPEAPNTMKAQAKVTIQP